MEVHQVRSERDEDSVVSVSKVDPEMIIPPVMISLGVRGGQLYTYLSVDEARELGGLLLATADEAEAERSKS